MKLLKIISRATLGLLACTITGGLALSLTMETAVAKPYIKSLSSKPVAFTSIPGWRRDDHAKAFAAFLLSCEKISLGRDRLAVACRKARRLPKKLSNNRARVFFESYFTARKVHSGRRSLLTGYYEPELYGSRVRTKKFNVPLYRRPGDLVGLHERGMRRAARRSGLSRKLTYAKRTRSGLKPYMTREQIESGGLNGQGLEMIWLADPVDAFFLHIQGSGRIVLPDGSRIRIGFDGKNGYDYSSVGRALVRAKLIPRNKVSLKSVKSWLRANPSQGRRAMWRNKSFIFFRELKNHALINGPIGAQGVSLIGGRSLAVDRRHYRLGLPIFLSVPKFRKDGQRNLRRLMIAQDTGTAIKGARRGDIFWGSGGKAGEIAGRTYHKGEFFVLLPRAKPIFVNAAKDRPIAKRSSAMKMIKKVPAPKVVRELKQPRAQKRAPVFEGYGVHAFSSFKSESN